MATRKITNPVPQVTHMTASADALLTHVLTNAKATHQSALSLCFAGAAFILKVSHFTDAKADGFMNRGDAVEYLKEKIKEQTGVKNRMLDQYINVSTKIAGFLMGSTKMFSPVLQQIGLAPDAETATTIIHSWWEASRNKKIENMDDLNESLGYAARKDRGNGNAITAENAGKRVETLMETLHENVIGDGRGKLPETAIVAPIMNSVVKKGDFLVEAIKNTFELSALDAAEKAIKDQRAQLKKLAAEAQKLDNVVNLPVKTGKAVKAAVAAKARGKGKHASTRRATA